MECNKCKCVCNAKYFQQNFKNWTSGNNDIDKFIQDTQLSIHSDYEVSKALEWIPYDRFYIIKDKFSRTNWNEGPIDKWDDKNLSWRRKDQNMFVILKRLNSPNNIALELKEITVLHKVYGITQDPETKNYMVVCNEKCSKCNSICFAIHFQRNFENWTSGNNNIDKFIQNTQLSDHTVYIVKKALEWIPYDRFYDIKYFMEDELGKVYLANWTDGYISYWDNSNCKRYNNNMFVILKSLNNPDAITSEFVDKITMHHKFYGITLDLETKNYMVVLACKKCSHVCNTIHFRHNFENWTSGNNHIDKFIQDTQLSNCYDYKALEWIPYDRLNDIKYIASSNFGNMYGANWIDGYILHWDFNNWERKGQNMFVVLKNLDNLNDITPEFTINEIAINHKVYGITQDPEAKIYMVVCNEICEKCNSSCLATHFHHNFESWTSGNNNIDKFIQDTQLSIHSDYKVSKALEWIPYDRFCGIKYFTDDEFGKVYLANWIDGYISYWDSEDHKIGRKGENMFIILKMLNNPNNIASEFANKVMIYQTFYGITQDPETKNYMFVCNEICEKCNCICFAMHFQRNFENWTSGNDNINIHIQHTQLSAHSDQLSKVLEWIHYDKLCNVEYLAEDENSKIYQANWIDGYIVSWDDNWKRGGQNMFVSLKTLDNPNDITSEFKNKITIHDRVYGITQDPETKNYMLVLSSICKKCNCTCLAMHFHQNFVNWTSSNDDIDKFIQNIQLSIHSDYEVSKALEWIPYNRFYNIKYIAKGGFGKIYRANWYDGYMQHWDYEKCKWSRQDQNKFVALKSLDNSKNVTLEFMNEITWHYKVNDLLHAVIKFYGITQDPITKNYMMVLNYVENGSLRDFLNTSHDKLNWYDRLNCLWIIAYALNLLHKNNLIHRDLHVGNILYDNNTRIYITDMGLCKSADYNASENSKESAYGILPYMAPEILRGQNCTKAADIYSFGIIMYEVISGLPPYHDMNHNNLAIRICKGLRPRFNIKVPQLIVHLIKRCLDANPLNRPTANEIYKIIREWHDKRSDYQITELQKQIEESEGTNKNLSIKSTSLGLSCNTRSEAIYTSGLLNCNSNLPEPKNSDDYYEQNDDIVSMEFTESLQIDISQLKNSDSITSDDYSEYSGSIQINIEDHDSKS